MSHSEVLLVSEIRIRRNEDLEGLELSRVEKLAVRQG